MILNLKKNLSNDDDTIQKIFSFNIKIVGICILDLKSNIVRYNKRKFNFN